MTPSFPLAALKPIPGLEGPKDLNMEEYREYSFLDNLDREVVYRIDNPIALYYREGGTTHRVVDMHGIVHCVPAPGHFGCVLRWRNRDVEIGADPVSY